MHKESQNLMALLQQNHDALSYFNKLPAYVRDMIDSRGNEIYSFDDLKSYADNLLSGDK